MPLQPRPPARRVTPGGAALAAVVLAATAACSSGTDRSPAATATGASPAAPTSASSSTSTTTVTVATPADTLTTDTLTTDTLTTVTLTTAAGDLATFLATELAEIERALRDPALDPVADAEVLAELGRRQQRAYRQLARNDELDDEVLALLPADVATAVGWNVAARQAVAAHAATRPPTDPPTTLPAWTIESPAPVDELLGYYAEAEALTGVPWEHLAAINFVETRMGRIGGESSAGAIGPMQFLPETWAECCTGDPTDPHDAIVGAAVYLAANGAPADMAAALYAYNPNDGYVGQVEAYAANLRADPLAYLGYHGWEVFVGTAAGTVRLPTGYHADEPQDAAAYVAAHPEDLVT